MEEIIVALKEWETARTNTDQLISLFAGKTGFKLDASLFPAGIPLHAYPGIKNNELGFYVISEEHDVPSPTETLSAHCHWFPCEVILANDQEIPEEEALARIEVWQTTFVEWIAQVVPSQFGMYQTFHIPTSGLQPEKYSVFFALKNNDATPGLKAADLVLKSNTNLYFDTVVEEPPYRDRSKYYILDLL